MGKHRRTTGGSPPPDSLDPGDDRWPHVSPRASGAGRGSTRAPALGV